MKTRKFQIAIIALMFIGAVSNTAFAQKGDFQWGVSASLIMPTGDFSSKMDNGYKVEHGTGWGVTTIGKYGINDFLHLVGTFGYSSVSETVTNHMYYEKLAVAKTSDEEYVPGSDNYGFFDFTAGLRANVSFAYVEGRLGYYTGDLGGFAFVPAIGAEFGKWDIQANYAIVGDSSNFGIRLGYYFF